MNGYNYWSVSWAVPRTDTDGTTTYWFEQYSAQDESDARSMARMRSQRSHAAVCDRNGLVATYVNGCEFVPAGTLKVGDEIRIEAEGEFEPTITHMTVTEREPS